MIFRRREFLRLTTGAAALPVLAPFETARAAASYPSWPVRVIVGFAPSGAADILARLIAQRLSERLGQAFVVENRPGAAMNIATGYVAKAPPDGYTLLNITTINAWNGSLYRHLDYDFIRDITPVATCRAPAAYSKCIRRCR